MITKGMGFGIRQLVSYLSRLSILFCQMNTYLSSNVIVKFELGIFSAPKPEHGTIRV